jgi:hypothetical protein
MKNGDHAGKRSERSGDPGADGECASDVGGVAASRELCTKVCRRTCCCGHVLPIYRAIDGFLTGWAALAAAVEDCLGLPYGNITGWAEIQAQRSRAS